MTAAANEAAGPLERELAARVLSTLLREDYGGLADEVGIGAHGVTLRLPGSGGPGRRVPLERDGFLADYRVPATAPVTLGDVRTVVAALAGKRDTDGAAVLDAECRRALAEARLRARCLPGGTGPAWPDGTGLSDGTAWSGAAGQLRYDALAAALPHPAYPASPCRLGLDDTDLVAYAPEFRPAFRLRWVAVPRAVITRTAGDALPAWWPDMAQAGLPPGLAATHELFPVHPLTARDRLPGVIREVTGAVLFGPEPYLRVRPTLSVRTVAVAEHPGDHLKMPLSVSTLGARNRRSLGLGTLEDGALVYRILAGLRERDPDLACLVLADDTTAAHAGHPELGYLWRRLPPGLDGARIVPVAALTARGPSGRLVIEELSDYDGGPDALAFTAAYFRLVLGLAVRLLVRYGIALESHQQNAALVVAPGAPLRLLVKDFDGTLINLGRLRDALGPGAPEAKEFADQRLLTESDTALADVLVTITVHLCVGAVAFRLAEDGAAPLGGLLAAAREALDGALAALSPHPAAALLRARVLDAERLTGKSMLSAGTLTDKWHTGAADINKFYGTTGPNYLREMTP
jgi:siderophore synthetase component